MFGHSGVSSDAVASARLLRGAFTTQVTTPLLYGTTTEPVDLPTLKVVGGLAVVDSERNSLIVPRLAFVPNESSPVVRLLKLKYAVRVPSVFLVIHSAPIVSSAGSSVGVAEGVAVTVGVTVGVRLGVGEIVGVLDGDAVGVLVGV